MSAMLRSMVWNGYISFLFWTGFMAYLATNVARSCWSGMAAGGLYTVSFVDEDIL